MDDHPATPAELPGSIEGQKAWGNFHLATVMFRRALQLRSGAKPRVYTNGHKFVHVAFLEVTAGAVSWEVSRG